MTDDAQDPESGAPGGPGNLLAILQAIGFVVIAVIPAFLTGALAVGMRADLRFGPAALGLGVSWFFVTASVSATPMGQLVERLGTRRSLMVGATASGMALLTISLAPSFPWILAGMTAGGIGNAITQPAVNASLSRRIPLARLGLAFGVKQSAIPMATLLGGLAVPTLAVLLGWRGAFGVATGAAAMAVVVAWRGGDAGGGTPVRPTRRRVRDMPEVRSLAILGVGGLLGAAAATSLGVFLVDAAVVGGMQEARAGLLFALVSACGLVARVTLGWYADVRPARSRYGTIAVLLSIGAPGYVLLTLGSTPLYLVGAFFAYGAGWAWPGLFHFAVVSQNPVSPAAATGVVQTGMSLGAGLGPLVFGWVAERAGYETAWFVAAALSLASAAVLLAGRAHLRRTRRTASAAHLDEVEALVWDEAPSQRVTTGVAMQQRVTDNLRVILYRADSGAAFDPPPATRTGVVFVVFGGEVHLRIAGVERIAATGDYVPLPANRPWSLCNRGSGTLMVAHVDHPGNS